MKNHHHHRLLYNTSSRSGSPLTHHSLPPERDVMINYRVKKITKCGGDVLYQPQKKFLWFWKDLGKPFPNNLLWANDAIFIDFRNSQNTKIDKVEYLEPHNSRSARQEPNPPPRAP